MSLNATSQEYNSTDDLEVRFDDPHPLSGVRGHVDHLDIERGKARALIRRFGDKVGGDYSEREDTGLFWSNDPQQSIGRMIRALGLPDPHSEHP